jgi:elongator complex protein 3
MQSGARAARVRYGGACALARPEEVPASSTPLAHATKTGADRQGIGTLLMEEAERIAREEHGSGRIAVISGVGTRDYYRRLGYFLDGPYMVKDLLYDE